MRLHGQFNEAHILGLKQGAFDLSMSPNRLELEPDRRAQKHARRVGRGVLIRDACWALIVAIIVLGGAKLVASVVGGL
jgi:hypothetical protein